MPHLQPRPAHRSRERGPAQVPLDPKAPYVLDTRSLRRQTGAGTELSRTSPAPAGLDQDVVGVPAGTPVQLDLRLDVVTEGVLVTGQVATPVQGECARCLDPVALELTVELCELFAYPDSATDETTAADEVPRLVDDMIDLEPVVRDAIVLALPVAPLCRPDCPGLCVGCGQRLDDLPSDHTHDTIDPRWAALAGRTSEPDRRPSSENESQE